MFEDLKTLVWFLKKRTEKLLLPTLKYLDRDGFEPKEEQKKNLLVGKRVIK